MDETALQDRYAPHGICFGCGPANEKGLRIKSQWEGDDCVMRFTPSPEHQAFPGVLNGGIIGTLLDCHMNWCALSTLMKQRGLDEAPVTVTAEFSVKLRRPCPADRELIVRARSVEIDGDKVTVEGEIVVDDKVQATGRGIFVAVKPGHPAYHRWG